MGWRSPLLPDPARRRFVKGLAAGLLLNAPVWPKLGCAGDGLQSVPELAGTEFDLILAKTPVNITVNGLLPAPALRWREGDTVTLRVKNTLDEPTSIHWHGISAGNRMTCC